MSLLFDHNLSHRLVSLLADVFPNAIHVKYLGLERGSDDLVRQIAREHGYIIVTKDSDFNDLIVLRGPPPKVIWLRIGNCPTSRIVALLRQHRATIISFAVDQGSALLTFVEDT